MSIYLGGTEFLKAYIDMTIKRIQASNLRAASMLTVPANDPTGEIERNAGIEWLEHDTPDNPIVPQEIPIWDLNKMAGELWRDTHDTSKKPSEYSLFNINPATYDFWGSSVFREIRKHKKQKVSRAVTCSICDSEDFDALFRPSDLVPDVTVRSNYYVCTDCFIGKLLPMMDTFVKDLSKASSFAYGASTAVPEEDTQPGGTMARRTCWGCYKGLCKVHRQT